MTGYIGIFLCFVLPLVVNGALVRLQEPIDDGAAATVEVAAFQQTANPVPAGIMTREGVSLRADTDDPVRGIVRSVKLWRALVQERRYTEALLVGWQGMVYNSLVQSWGKQDQLTAALRQHGLVGQQATWTSSMLEQLEMVAGRRNAVDGGRFSGTHAQQWPPPTQARAGKKQYDIGLVTVCDYNATDTPLTGVAARNRRRLAERHGYTLYFDTRPYDRRRHPAWAKVPALARRAARHDWLVWLDCDTLWLRQDRPFEELIAFAEESAAQFAYPLRMGPVAQQPRDGKGGVNFIVTDDGMMMNTGVFLMRGGEWGYRLLRHFYGPTTLGTGDLDEKAPDRPVEGRHSPFNRYGWRSPSGATPFLDHPQWEQVAIVTALYQGMAEWQHSRELPSGSAQLPHFCSAELGYDGSWCDGLAGRSGSAAERDYDPGQALPPLNATAFPSFGRDTGDSPPQETPETTAQLVREFFESTVVVPQRWMNSYPAVAASKIKTASGQLMHAAYHPGDTAMSLSGCVHYVGKEGCRQMIAEVAALAS